MVCRDILLGAPSVATEVTAVKELAVVAGALEPGWWSFGFARMLLVGRLGQPRSGPFGLLVLRVSQPAGWEGFGLVFDCLLLSLILRSGWR